MLQIANGTGGTLSLCISTAPQSPNHEAASSSCKAWRTDEFHYGQSRQPNHSSQQRLWVQ